MQKRSKRVQKKLSEQRRSIQQLVLALNNRLPGAPGIRPRRPFIEAFHRMIPHAGTLARIVLRLQRLVVDPPKVVDVSDHLDTPAARHLHSLNQQLASYTSFPYISTDGKGGWSFDWEVQVTVYGDNDNLGFITRGRRELPHALTAIGLAREGLIDRVRRCPIDRRWFYARTKESRFCCSECRNLFHQSDPKDKERRRIWARENYQSRKELEVGSRKAVKRNGGKR